LAFAAEFWWPGHAFPRGSLFAGAARPLLVLVSLFPPPRKHFAAFSSFEALAYFSRFA